MDQPPSFTSDRSIGPESAAAKTWAAGTGSPLGEVLGPAPRGGLRVPVWAWVLLWHLAGVGGALGLHFHLHRTINGWHAALATFLVTNLLIAGWEIALFFRIGDLERLYAQGRLVDPSTLWTARASVGDVLSTRLWSLVWLVYCRFDPSYADRRSYGFTIDVGNGFFSPIPSLLLLVGMSVPLLPPVALGILGIAVFYQKLHGTVLYFFQFAFNRRHAGHRALALLGNVVLTNGIWIALPLVGIVVSIRLVLDGSYALLWS